MDWTKITALEIPEGSVVKITCGEKVLWNKSGGENRWNLLERSELRGPGSGAGTYSFDPTISDITMSIDENVWLNGGRVMNSLCYFYSNWDTQQDYYSTLTDITDDRFTMISGTKAAGLAVAFPFHLNAGDTINVVFTRSGLVQGGYGILNADGTHRSFFYESLPNTPGSIKSYEFTAPDECWFIWAVGQYAKGETLTVSDISVTVA